MAAPFVGLFIFIFGVNVLSFHCTTADHPTQFWYSTSWIEAPYTNLRVAMRPSLIYKTTNVTGDEWIVKDTVIDGNTWWTVLNTRPKVEPETTSYSATNENY